MSESKYSTPKVYIEEIAKLPPSVAEVTTAVPVFIGRTEKGAPTDAEPVAVRISSMIEYEQIFGGPKKHFFTVSVTEVNNVLSAEITSPTNLKKPQTLILHESLKLFFDNGGGSCYVVSIGDHAATPLDNTMLENGIKAAALVDEPTLIVCPDAVALTSANYKTYMEKALESCASLQDRFAIFDVMNDSIDTTKTINQNATDFRENSPGGPDSNLKYGACYYPNLLTSLTYSYNENEVTLAGDETGKLDSIATSKTQIYNLVKAKLASINVVLPPSPAVAGAYVKTDGRQGVWKAPANVSLASVLAPTVIINDKDQANLNYDADTGKSINAIRSFTGKGTLIWGARTLLGNDNEWRYVSVRRLFIFIEESLRKATAYAVFEPNTALTWLKLSTMIESFLRNLWERGALAGATPEESFYINVGLGKSMTQEDVLQGRLIVEIGIAAVRPAEFIILRFSHLLQQS